MGWIFVCDLGLNKKTLPCNFFYAGLLLVFSEIMHTKLQVFLNRPWRQMRTSLIPLFGKDTARKKNCVFAYTICGKWKRNHRTKMFFYEVEGHTQKLSSFGQVKNIRPKKSLKLVMQVPIQLISCVAVPLPPPPLNPPLGTLFSANSTLMFCPRNSVPANKRSNGCNNLGQWNRYSDKESLVPI